MPSALLAKAGGILPIALAAFGIVTLILIATLRRFSGAGVATEPAGEDLLTQAEEEAVRVLHQVRKAMEMEAAAEAATEETPEVADAPAEADAIDWEEQDDVYRPETVDAARFLQSLRLERPPEIAPDQSYIFIRQSAYAQLREHLRHDLTVELGGLLYGQAFHNPARSIYLLTIEAALPASDGIETATSFAYTAASWQALTPRLQELDSSWTLIGSYHSHPGLGVFLSKTDLDTQETIFAQDWQIALVVDPIADELGFFVGKEGSPCPHWFILPDR